MHLVKINAYLKITKDLINLLSDTKKANGNHDLLIKANYKSKFFRPSQVSEEVRELLKIIKKMVGKTRFNSSPTFSISIGWLSWEQVYIVGTSKWII